MKIIALCGFKKSFKANAILICYEYEHTQF